MKALQRADSLPGSTLKQQLAAHMVDPQLSHVLSVVKQHQIKNVRTYGAVVVRIEDVQVNDKEATVRDCQDASKAGLQNTKTQKKINRGLSKRSVKASLKKGVDGRWRVSKFVELRGGC